jgi:hypothetical protein
MRANFSPVRASLSRTNMSLLTGNLFPMAFPGITAFTSSSACTRDISYFHNYFFGKTKYRIQEEYYMLK